MNEHLPITDQEIMDYLDGVMEKPERELLEMEMTMNETLRIRVEKMRVAILAVKQIGLKEKIKEIIKEPRELTTLHSSGQAPSQSNKVAQRKIIRYTMAVAASVILFIIVFKPFQHKPTTEELFLQAYVDYDASGVRGNEKVSLVEDAYRQKKFIVVYSLGLNKKATSQKDSLLIGISSLMIGIPSDAIKWLEPISHEGAFQQDAEYYLALSYLKNGDTKTAASLMRKIHDNPSHVYRNQFSEELIKKVERK